MGLTTTGGVLWLCSSLRKGRSAVLSPCPFGFLVDPGGSALELALVGCLVEEQASGLGVCAVGQQQEATFLVVLGAFLLEAVSIAVVEAWEVVSVLVFLEMSMVSSLGMKR